MSLMVVHCPGGITEKDLKTFFARVLDRNLPSELGAGLQLLERHNGATWKDARLKIVGPWGGVCFVAGSGSNVFVVRVQQPPGHSLRASLENLLFGFFRLLLAMASLMKGTFVVLTLTNKLAFSLSDMSEDEACLKVLYIVHHVLRAGVAVITAMDTAYGTETLLGSRTGDDVEERKELWETLTNDVERDSDGDSNTKQEEMSFKTEHATSRDRTSKLQTVDSVEADCDGDDEYRERSASRDIFYVEAWGAYDKIARRRKTSSSQCCPEGRVSTTLFSPGDKWLMRGGMYLALASSGSGTELGAAPAGSSLVEQLNAHCVISAMFACSDCLLYTGGILAMLIAGVGYLFPGCLTTPWAQEMKGDSFITADSGPDGDPHVTHLSRHRSRGCHGGTRRCQILSKLVCLLTVATLGVVHVLKLTSMASTSCRTSSCSSCCQINESNFEMISDSQCRDTFLQLIASCFLTSLSPATLCACVSMWVIANLVLEVRGRQLSWASSLSFAVLYLCCLSTMSSSETETGFITDGVGCTGTSDAQANVTGGYNEHIIPHPTSFLSWFSSLDRILSWLETGLVTLILSVAAVILPLCFLLIGQLLATRHKRHLNKQTPKEMPNQKSRRHSNTENYYKLRSRTTVFKLVQAAATLISLCGLGLALMAFSWPWLTVTTSSGPGFHSLARHLKNFSMQLEVNLVAASSVLATPICSREKVNFLSSELSTSRKAVAKVSVEDIANYCRTLVCQNESQTHWNQSEAKRRRRVTFCAKFCSTLAFFQDKLDYSPSLHDPLAKVVKGDNKTEQTFLKSVVLKEKKRFLDEFPQRREWAKMQESLQSNGDASELITDGTFSDLLSVPPKYRGTNVVPGEQQQLMSAYARDGQGTESSSTCMRVLCVLRGLSMAGMAAPLIGWMFQATFVTVQALLGVAKLMARVEELVTIFSDFKVLVESLALHLEHSQEAKTLYFSITNYSLVYLAYPALITGGIGILAGFWHRHQVPFSRPRRFAYAVALPLLALNVFGAAVAVFWAYVVESLAGFVAPVHVTASLESGGRLLLAAFTCGGCSSLMFLLLALLYFDPPCSHQRPSDASRCTQECRAAPSGSSSHHDNPRTLLCQIKNEMSEFRCPAATGKCSKKSDAASCSQSLKPAGANPGGTAVGGSPHPTPGQLRCGDVETLPGLPSSAGTQRGSYDWSCSSLPDTHESCASACSPHSCVSSSTGLGAPPPGSQLVAGCRPWLLAVLLACAGCGLMFTCMHVPVFRVHINLHRDFDVLLGRVEQTGNALEISRHVLTQEEPCDVTEVIGREMLLYYLSTLKELDVQPLTQTLREFGTNVKSKVNTALPLILIPCLVALAAAFALVVYGAVAAKIFKPQSRCTLPLSAAASGTRRLAVLSIAWLLHACVLLAGPAANAAVSNVVDMHVQLTPAFVVAVAAHVMVLLAALELHLANVFPLV